MPRDRDPPVNFDLDRMKASLDSGNIRLPHGLPRGQIRQFIRDCLTPKDLQHQSAHEIVRGLVLG